MPKREQKTILGEISAKFICTLGVVRVFLSRTQNAESKKEKKKKRRDMFNYLKWKSFLWKKQHQVGRPMITLKSSKYKIKGKYP